jgi:ElaB/YqjD/DUF883 family membrane-anchored ribosome-binding protein
MVAKQASHPTSSNGVNIARKNGFPLAELSVSGPRYALPFSVQEDEMAEMKNTTGADHKSAKDTALDLGDKAMEFGDRVTERATDAYHEVATRAQQAGDAVSGYAGRAADSLDDSIQNRPMTALLGAVAAGFVAGALWKR